MKRNQVSISPEQREGSPKGAEFDQMTHFMKKLGPLAHERKFKKRVALTNGTWKENQNLKRPTTTVNDNSKGHDLIEKLAHSNFEDPNDSLPSPKLLNRLKVQTHDEDSLLQSTRQETKEMQNIG